MAKLIRKRIEGCRECPAYGVSWCNHRRGWRIVEDFKSIPNWCPLPDWSDV